AAAARPSQRGWTSLRSLLRVRHEQNLVDFVHLDELHLDALGARGRKVLADVVGADRKLAVAAVDEHRELDARGAAVVEERLDRCADRAPRVEDVVDEDDGAAVEREVELRLADERLGVQRSFAAAHLHVVAIEGDVDGAELGRLAGALSDQPCKALRERDAACLDADECDAVELGIALDDLVRDPRECSRECVGVEAEFAGFRLGGDVHGQATPFRPHWPGLKGLRSRAQYRARRMDGNLLGRYADLIVSVGANVQPDQVVAVEALPDARPLVQEIATRAYDKGARYVDVQYFDPDVKRIRAARAAEESLPWVPPWLGRRLLTLGELDAARIVLVPL